MYKEHRQLLLLVINFLSIIILGACTNRNRDAFEVIEYHYSDQKWPCIVKKEGEKYLVIDNIRKYTDGKLIAYQGCASEGLNYIDFEKNADYNEDDKKVKKLSIFKNKKQIVFFNEVYNIEDVNKDSIFVKSLNKDKYLVFKGNIPEE